MGATIMNSRLANSCDGVFKTCKCGGMLGIDSDKCIVR
jgi:hypothetical protein